MIKTPRKTLFKTNNTHDGEMKKKKEKEEKKTKKRETIVVLRRMKRVMRVRTERSARCGRNCSSTITHTKKKSKDDDDSLFEQKQYQTIQWLKNGGWRSGRLSKGRFIVEKAKKIKRKSGMRVFGGGGGGGKGGGDQNQTRASSSLLSSFKSFDGSLLLSDENGDTMTATCDGRRFRCSLIIRMRQKRERRG